ncbi:30924_t:CDS:2, partial [Gigaspora margarita]
EAPVVPDKKDEIIEALVKQVQQLSVNYTAANNQQYGEKGNIARNCMSEKKPKGTSEAERAQPESIGRVNYCENELYVADKRNQQIQLDIPEKRPKLQPELQWDNRLRPRPENEPLLVDIGEQSQPMELEESRMEKDQLDSDSRDEFDEYTYEDKELVETKGYYTEETNKEGNELFYNPWEE